MEVMWGVPLPNRPNLLVISDGPVLRDESDFLGHRGGTDQPVAGVAGIG